MTDPMEFNENSFDFSSFAYSLLYRKLRLTNAPDVAKRKLYIGMLAQIHAEAKTLGEEDTSTLVKLFEIKNAHWKEMIDILIVDKYIVKGVIGKNEFMELFSKNFPDTFKEMTKLGMEVPIELNPVKLN